MYLRIGCIFRLLSSGKFKFIRADVHECISHVDYRNIIQPDDKTIAGRGDLFFKFTEWICYGTDPLSAANALSALNIGVK